jgi:hypothetical protein
MVGNGAAPASTANPSRMMTSHGIVSMRRTLQQRAALRRGAARLEDIGTAYIHHKRFDSQAGREQSQLSAIYCLDSPISCGERC